MTTRLARHISGIAGIGIIAVMVTACGGGAAKVASAAAVSPGDSQVAAPASPVDATAATVHATGGGKFCTEIAASINKAQTNAAGASSADIKKQLDTARATEHQALNNAPSAIKPDVAVLITASDKIYDALAKVGDDYTKLTPADMAVYSSPAFAAAEQHVVAYLKDTCGIDTGAAAAAAAASAAAGAPDSADPASTDTADAAAGSSDSGSACNLATVAEISAGAGKPMKLTGGEGPICAFGAVDDPSFFIYAQTYDDADGLAKMTQVEGEGSDHLDGLGDDAFWNKTLGAVYVRKGSRAFSFTLPSLANMTDNPDAIKSNMVTLATAAAARF